MELLILTGVLVAGIGVGLSFAGRESAPVVCHCECSSEKTSSAAGGSSIRDILLSWAFCWHGCGGRLKAIQYPRRVRASEGSTAPEFLCKSQDE